MDSCTPHWLRQSGAPSLRLLKDRQAIDGSEISVGTAFSLTPHCLAPLCLSFPLISFCFITTSPQVLCLEPNTGTTLWWLGAGRFPMAPGCPIPSGSQQKAQSIFFLLSVLPPFLLQSAQYPPAVLWCRHYWSLSSLKVLCFSDDFSFLRTVVLTGSPEQSSLMNGTHTVVHRDLSLESLGFKEGCQPLSWARLVSELGW